MPYEAIAGRRARSPSVIPGTTNTFGGNSAAEFGPLLFLDCPGPVFTPLHRTNDFRQVLDDNPCLNEST
jgi:hypothetical protein